MGFFWEWPRANCALRLFILHGQKVSQQCVGHLEFFVVAENQCLTKRWQVVVGNFNLLHGMSRPLDGHLIGYIKDCVTSELPGSSKLRQAFY